MWHEQATKQTYRAVGIASEPIASEHWLQVPDTTVFSVDPDVRLRIKPQVPATVGEI
ncbi:MAG: hypothetical protein GY791_00385 [Alphaproteobacteria bacterium]|nr:hypothetical protein [Alphaproteobacteria bacterium]